MPDFTVQHEGTIFLVIPNTPSAQEWIDEHIDDTAQYFGTAVVVEHRYIVDLIDGILAEGLSVS
jgi:hypothetical protein